jgi:hypothetical protein
MALGTVVVILGLTGLVIDLTRSPRTAHADAVVVDVIEHTANRGQRLYQPVLEFTADGRRVRFAAAIRVRDRTTYPLGSTRPVEYDPGNPADARLDTTWQRWGRWLAIVGLGLVLITIGGLGRRPLLSPPGPPPVAHGA